MTESAEKADRLLCFVFNNYYFLDKTMHNARGHLTYIAVAQFLPVIFSSVLSDKTLLLNMIIAIKLRNELLLKVCFHNLII